MLSFCFFDSDFEKAWQWNFASCSLFQAGEEDKEGYLPIFLIEFKQMTAKCWKLLEKYMGPV